jgi:hypothetical protein
MASAIRYSNRPTSHSRYVSQCTLILMSSGMLFVPESPRFLLSMGRHEDARKALKRYRSKKAEHDGAVEAELVEMRTQIDWGMS